MKRIGVTSFFGALLGAIEGAAIFGFVLVLESREGHMLGGLDTWLLLVLIMGGIVGLIFGGILGLIIALLRAPLPTGVAIGVGLAALVILVLILMGFPLDYLTLVLAMAAMIGGASIGLVTAQITSRPYEQ